MNNIDEEYISFIDESMQVKFASEDKWTKRKTPKDIRSAILLVNRSKRDEAINKIDNYIKKNNDPMAYIIRGDIYDDIGLKERAIDDYNQAISIAPTLSGAYDRKGTALAELGKELDAIEEYKKAVHIRPKAMYYFNMGVAYESIDDNLNAIYAQSKALELNDKYPKAYYMRGISYYQVGDYYNAIADYNSALLLSPEFISDVYFRRAESYEAIGEKDKAISDYRKTLELIFNAEDIKIVEEKIMSLSE